jgi:DNA-binding SARP family transcriptional activator/tetratricopeptide (TPR) repeat protein
VIQVRTLGGIHVDSAVRSDARGIVAQPKRFALLVYLAVAKPRGPQRRDTLLSLLWPEADQERGRSALRQALYLLRQSLGAEALKSRGDEDIELDPAVVSCDVTGFESAVAEGRFGDALDLYGGDFLTGFHAPEVAAEYDEWVEGERRRLRALAGTAAWTLAARDESVGHGSGAVYWARRAVSLDRDNEDAVRDLMLILARVGDRVGAARVYDEHARRLRDELGGLTPGQRLAQVAAQLRAAAPPEPPAPVPSRSVDPPPALAGPQDSAAQVLRPRSASAVANAGAEPAPVAPDSERPALPGRLSRNRVRPLLIGLGAMLALTAAIIVTVPRAARGPNVIPLLAVGPIIEVSGADSIGESPIAGDLLATGLARLPGLEVIPAVRLAEIAAQLRAVGASDAGLLAAARQAGADRLVHGVLRRTAGGGLLLDGQLTDLRLNTVVRAFRVEGPDYFALADQATLAVANALGAATPAAPLAAVTTRSLVALRLFQEGMRALFNDDQTAALRILEAAIEEDSGFAMAEYYAGLIGTSLARPEATAHLLRASRLADHVPDRERLMIRYRVARLRGLADARPLAETLAVRYPGDPDAQFALGQLRQEDGDWPAAVRQFRRTVEMDSLSLRAPRGRCLACEAYGDLFETYLLADSAAAAERTVRDMIRRRGEHRSLYHLLALAQLRQFRVREALASWATLDSLEGRSKGSSFQAAWAAIFAGDLPAADSLLVTLAAAAAPQGRGEIDWFVAIARRNEGRLADAAALAHDPQMRAIVAFESGQFRDAADRFRALAHSPPEDFPDALGARIRAWNLTHVATALAAQGDTAALSALADTVQTIGALSTYGRDHLLHHYIRGLLWSARGMPGPAADAFRRSIWSWTDGYTRANLELARSLLSLGRPRVALYPLQTALRGDLQSSNLYVTRTELHELLGTAFALVGARDSAAAHFRLVARAWEHADPIFRERRQRALAYLAGH